MIRNPGPSPVPSTSAGRVLIVHAHADSAHSRAGTRLMHVAARIDFVETRSVYELYPHGFIDARIELEAIDRAAAIVFLHPLLWYSVPSMLKEWIDTVLAAQWRADRKSRLLEGKIWIHAVTVGGAESGYGIDGAHRHPLETYLLPLHQTARQCGARWMSPWALFDSQRLNEAQLEAAADEFAQMLSSIRKGAVERRRTPRLSPSSIDAAPPQASAVATRAAPNDQMPTTTGRPALASHGDAPIADSSREKALHARA